MPLALASKEKETRAQIPIEMVLEVPVIDAEVTLRHSVNSRFGPSVLYLVPATV